MGAIIINSDNAKNLKLLAALAEQFGESISKLTKSQIEDMQLGMLMKKEKQVYLLPEKLYLNILTRNES